MKIENIADLRVLVHTARGGTLTAAAHALGITPAAASATLKRLEAQLGARLFERSTRAQHNCLTFNRSGRRHRVWRFALNGQWTEVRVNGNRSVDDASLAREWTVAGHGISLKSALDVRNDLREGRLVRLLPEWDTEPYPLHALLPSGRFVPARVRAFVDFLALKFDALLAVD